MHCRYCSLFKCRCLFISSAAGQRPIYRRRAIHLATASARTVALRTAASRPIIAAIELSLFSREPFSPSQIKSRRFPRRRRSVVTHDLSLMAASPAGVSRETLAGNLCRPRQAAFTRCGGRRRDPSHDRIAQRSRATRRRDYRTS